MQVLDSRGLHLPQHDLWLDPHHTRPVAFVSHAHADHMKKHGRVFATSATAAMMQARGAVKSQFHLLGWREPLRWGRASVSFYPAGHVLGSAQMLVEADGTSLLYSGDFKLRDSLSAEKIEVPRADILVMETTFGHPRYRFPETAAVVEHIAQWCGEVLGRGSIPALFCYSLGKGQEVLAGLHDHDFPLHLHLKHAQMTAIYANHGIDFPKYSIHQPGDDFEGVLLCASQCKRSKWWDELTSKRRVETAYISGWALGSHPNRFGTDAAFALSDHAGYGICSNMCGYRAPDRCGRRTVSRPNSPPIYARAVSQPRRYAKRKPRRFRPNYRSSEEQTQVATYRLEARLLGAKPPCGGSFCSSSGHEGGLGSRWPRL